MLIYGWTSRKRSGSGFGSLRQTLHDILDEKQPVTVEMAVRLGKPLGNGAGFRVNLQRSHDPTIARQPAHAPR